MLISGQSLSNILKPAIFTKELNESNLVFFISVVNRSDDTDGRLKGNYQPFIQCILRVK